MRKTCDVKLLQYLLHRQKVSVIVISVSAPSEYKWSILGLQAMVTKVVHLH